MKGPTEKITVNMNSMDLAKIDLLIEEGYYQNRTDFIKKSTYMELAEHSDAVTKKLKSLEMKNNVLAGVVKISEEFIRDLKSQPQNNKITVFGVCHIDKNISLKLLKESISDLKVYGVTYANKEIKNAYNL